MDIHVRELNMNLKILISDSFSVDCERVFLDTLLVKL